MAITQTYADFGNGNDYSGATFLDGAFANATLTLTKAGVFGANQINHWLYLADNGSGEVTAGYYRITSIAGAPNAVVLHADIRSGANDPVDVVCTQATGAVGLPWRSIQGALDLITIDAVNGDQINVQAGTAQVNTAAQTLAVYGAPAEAAPLVFRGYTAVADDGGIAEVDCGGVTALASNGYDYLQFIDMEWHTPGDNHLFNCSGGSRGCGWIHCEVHDGASNPSGRTLIFCGYDGQNIVVDCNVYFGTGGSTGIRDATQVIGCYVEGCSASGIQLGSNYTAMNNVVVTDTNGTGIYLNGDNCVAMNNTVYSPAASTGLGIGTKAGTAGLPTIINNLITGFSGVGGRGIGAAADVRLLGHNGYYNNTANETIVGDTFCDLGGDVILGADPFTAVGGDDFSLTAVAKAVLRDVGYPGGLLNAHADTDLHLTLGALQYGPTVAAGGRRPRFRRHGV